MDRINVQAERVQTISGMTSAAQEKKRVSNFTVFCGGSVGSDPYSPKTWSGSCAFFLRALDSAGILDRAVGIELPRWRSSLLMAKNFHRNRSVWRSHYYFDPAYRRALTQAAKRVPVNDTLLLQIGHMFSLPDAFPNRTCISYHDGNLVERLKSGLGFQGISRQRIDQALRYEEQVAGQMNLIFTFSEYLRQSFIADYHLPAERVVNVGGGINLAEIPEPTPLKDYSIPRILFVGKDFARKGGPQLLESFRAVRQAIPAAELHIVGPEKPANAPNQVFFHGFLSKQDPDQRQQLESLFRNSTLFVLPSLYEPFGIAPLEAMLYQLPCLVTDAWALREAVTPGFNGELVSRGSVEELSAKIIALLSQPDSLAQMGRQGRDRVLRTYTWSTVADRISAAITHL